MADVDTFLHQRCGDDIARGILPDRAHIGRLRSGPARKDGYVDTIPTGEHFAAGPVAIDNIVSDRGNPDHFAPLS
jgi:hypothetical protein